MSHEKGIYIYIYTQLTEKKPNIKGHLLYDSTYMKYQEQASEQAD